MVVVVEGRKGGGEHGIDGWCEWDEPVEAAVSPPPLPPTHSPRRPFMSSLGRKNTGAPPNLHTNTLPLSPPLT